MMVTSDSNLLVKCLPNSLPHVSEKNNGNAF